LPELGRFVQPDPKEFAAGDYNIYRYCHNDPVNKSDPTGLLPGLPGMGRALLVSFDPPTVLQESVWSKMSEADKKQYDAAKAHELISGAGTRLFDRIEKARTTFTLRTNDTHDDSYDPKTKTVNWDPKSALKTANGGRQSPAVGLTHEIDHALANPILSAIRSIIPAGKYENQEERRVIEGSERAIVRDLGEGLRHDHIYGDVYHVNDPGDR
jgi:uncharacterized protein RhaS with RHS repeats